MSKKESGKMMFGNLLKDKIKKQLITKKLSTNKLKQKRIDDIINKNTDNEKGSVKAIAYAMLPILKTISQFSLFVVLPIIINIIIQINKIQNILPLDVIDIIVGLLLTFFGGKFMLLISAYEALQVSGLEETKDNIKSIQKEYEHIMDNKNIKEKLISNASVKDKILIFLEHCKEPEKLSNAIGGIYITFIAVWATLKIQFAAIIVIAISISKYIQIPLIYVLGNPLNWLLGPKYNKWLSTIINILSKLVIFPFIFLIFETVGSVHCGIKGGLLVGRALIVLFYKLFKKNVKIDFNDTQIDEVIGQIIAGFGIQCQLISTPAFISFFGYLLSPIQLVEAQLRWKLAWDV